MHAVGGALNRQENPGQMLNPARERST